MILSRENLKMIKANGHLELPGQEIFSLPERVLQFGTGVLLRGLPDYFIDKANKRGIFKGRIVVVKSTDTSGADAFDKQNGLYTQCVRAVEKEKKIEEHIVNASISRVISANTDWNSVLECALNPQMQVIISNTTEVGIMLTEDKIHADPPVSFPGKLLAFLYKRFRHFKGDISKGMVIVPAELITDNGKKLESIALELAHQNNLESAFIDWLEAANVFCNSLVDRIVPGKLPATEQKEMETRLGYSDELMIMSEGYGLWAIEAGDSKVKEVLSFHKADDGIVIVPDINNYRELKLRLLNGSHTFSCGLAHLAGFKTVKEAMDNEEFASFITNLMVNEIAPAISGKNLSLEEAVNFARKVLDRYRNPYIKHQWLSISMQYSSKMRLRNIPVLKNFFEKTASVPECMTLGFAAYLLFMKCERESDGKFYGKSDGYRYLVNDDHAIYFSEKWEKLTPDKLVAEVAEDEKFWGYDLSNMNGFANAVAGKLKQLISEGPRQAIYKLVTEKIEV